VTQETSLITVIYSLILAADGYLNYHATVYTGTVWLIQKEG